MSYTLLNLKTDVEDMAPRFQMGDALAHYEEVIGDTVPDKLPMPLQVHRRAGEQCPRCGDTIQAIHFRDYVMCYCPTEQTGGRVLKDRRLSKLLK